MAATSLLPPVKSVVVYRNGDPFYSGRRFVVNQRQVTTMEAFLNEVTHSIGAPLAVRSLYTPTQGHRVTELQELQTGAQYVAAGSERFKKLDYLNVGTKKTPVTRQEKQAKNIQKTNVSAKWRKFIPVPFILHVFRNGDLLCPAFRFIVPRTLMRDLEQVLSLITEKVNLRTGAVRRLCSLEGVAVSSAAELETGGCYVAVGTERFQKLPYVELLVSTPRFLPGQRRQRRAEVNAVNYRRATKQDPKGHMNRKAGRGPDDQYSDSALLESPELDGRRVKSTGDEATASQGLKKHNGREAADDISGFFAKIRKNRLKTRAVPSKAQPSVFKRAARKRREEARGAVEVQEDENTATEFPVDQRVAETVEAEELNQTQDSRLQESKTEETASIMRPSSSSNSQNANGKQTECDPENETDQQDVHPQDRTTTAPQPGTPTL